ncbi:hypothetical protein [Streptomyces sp. NPDC001404]|uniref:hypothetical protein n=1 Tax=Streptomyces sp. NPDC001404 TaxID=3364571 RepID=UPI0036D0C98F
MPQHALNTSICRDCGGFASVAIALGERDAHGHLRTITAYCPACHGTGTRSARPVLARTGR